MAGCYLSGVDPAPTSSKGCHVKRYIVFAVGLLAVASAAIGLNAQEEVKKKLILKLTPFGKQILKDGLVILANFADMDGDGAMARRHREEPGMAPGCWSSCTERGERRGRWPVQAQEEPGDGPPRDRRHRGTGRSQASSGSRTIAPTRSDTLDPRLRGTFLTMFSTSTSPADLPPHQGR